MGLLVVADQIQVDDRQSPRNVDPRPQGDEVPQQNTDREPRGNELQFLFQVGARQDPAEEIRHRED